MNPDADAFFKLIIPGVFLLLWVLGQLANRESAANASRRGLEDPLGPRPDRLPPRTRGGSPTYSNPSGLVVVDPQTRQPGGIVFVEPSPSSRGSRSRPSRPSARRSNESTRGRKPPAEPSGRRTPAVGAIRVSGPLASPASSPDSAGAAVVESPTELAPITATQLQEAFRHPQRVREAFVASLVLGPPPGLGRLRSRRRFPAVEPPTGQTG
ncbi:MAG: hypothetical protein KatS3mg108_1615 [Isosphaeraceae bacterium]|jgi:hypothetical protein|nr:MAG: hypothetical protein KatS3mg108_1615 [Isosphaeraceae bacterium]